LVVTAGITPSHFIVIIQLFRGVKLFTFKYKK